MRKILSSSNRKKIGTTKMIFVLVALVGVLSMAAFVASDVSYGAKTITLTSSVCASIGGTWTTNTCTIAATSAGTAASSFTIRAGTTLDVKGSLTVNSGVTIANSGTIIVENAGGVNQTQEFDNWETGILLLGTLTNSGTMTIKNANDTSLPAGVEGTVGLSVWASATNLDNRSTYTFGALTNTGKINIQNLNQTRGIENIGTITNSATGTITVANSGNGSSSVGIYNRRTYGPVLGTFTNFGTITIKSSGNNSFGMYTAGILTNSGVLTINSLSGPYQGSNASLLFITGIYNSGAFTQTTSGTYYNYDGYINSADPLLADPELSAWGNYNNHGTMVNYGRLFTNGTFFTNGYTMINIGTINDTSTALLFDTGLQTGSSMINYGTIYNYGAIQRGEEYGICYDLVNGTGC